MRAKRFGAGFLFVASCMVFGFFLGGFLGSKVFSSGGMGWDRLADALGGMMAGVIVALVVSVALVRRLSIRQCLLWSFAALLGAALVFWLIRIYPKDEPPQPSQAEVVATFPPPSARRHPSASNLYAHALS